MSSCKLEKKYTYESSLSIIITKFVMEKRSLGYQYNTEAKNLARFDRFLLDERYNETALSRDIVEKYTAKTPYESVRNHRARFLLIQQFGKYMQANGHVAYVSPIFASIKRQDNFVPYIFTEEEISHLLQQADMIEYNQKCPYRHFAIPVLLRILYCCGLRLSEALSLQIQDVDLQKGILNITGAKFDKDRLVPMSASLIRYCKAYLEQVHHKSEPTNIFIPSSRGKKYGTRTIYTMFRRILYKAGISHGGKGIGPRLHDMRHTFAVHCLKKWVEQGTDISVALPFLSAYLGHVGLNSTQTYLRLTAELFPSITKSLNKMYGSIVPKVGGSDEYGL